MRFVDKVCVVTGGASGIGQATCKALADEGGKVAVLDINEEQGQETADKLTKAGYVASFISADVANSQEVIAAVDKVIKRWKRIDVLVNCAATMSFDPVVSLDDDEWDRVLSTNLKSVFLLSKYSLPHMSPGGSIINVSSVHAHRTTPNVAPYAASKGGMEAFTRSLSQECAIRDVRVDCVSPGAINTPLLWSNPLVQSGQETIEGRIGQPEDVAAAITFLAADTSHFITGTVLVVDGGRLTVLG